MAEIQELGTDIIISMTEKAGIYHAWEGVYNKN